MPSADEVPEKETTFAGEDRARQRIEELTGKLPEEKTTEQAMQDLVDLTEELGLYGETDAAGEPRVVAPGCPFCGHEMPCPSHRMGGPA